MPPPDKAGSDYILSRIIYFFYKRYYTSDFIRHHIKDRLFGFTLAEVLITLGIIGIVAALTMPAVISDTRKTTTARKLHQAYNFLQQTFTLAENEYGEMINWECNDIERACTEEEFAQKYIIPFFMDTELQTYKALVNAGYKDYPTLLNGETTMTGWRYYIRVKQGYLFMISRYDVDSHSRRFFSVDIDINGPQPPNVVGKDIFKTTYGYNLKSQNNYKLQMYNYSNSNRDKLLENNCNKNSSGDYCGALIQMDGWEIKDDYPW